MRAAIFTDNDFAKVNGVTTTLKAVLREATDGIQPRVYTAADVPSTDAGYFAVRSMGIGVPWYREMRLYCPRLLLFARQLRADGIQLVHITTPGPIGLAARWLAGHLRLPMVGSYHTQLGAYTQILSGSPQLGRVMESYMRWLYGRCDPMLVPSAATGSDLATRGYHAGRVRIWARGVDVDRFTPARRSIALRETWHVHDDRPVILYAGRLSREKGLHLVPPLTRKLAAVGLTHKLVFVGDGPMAAELRASCPDAVFAGSLPHPEVGTAMASADVFLFPSATDTLGNVVLEAQAAGLPVVVSDRGGPQELVSAGQNGLVCRAGESESFTAAVAELVRDAPWRIRMGEAAREFALTRSWRETLKPLFAAWREALVRGESAPVPGDGATFPLTRWP